MPMSEIDKKLRQEILDELSPLYMKPRPNSKFHIFYTGSTPMKCRCGHYTIKNDSDFEHNGKIYPAAMRGGVGPEIRATSPPNREVANACLVRHEHEVRRRTEAKRFGLQKDIEKIGSDLQEIIGEYIFVAVHTVDIDMLDRLRINVGNLVDAEVLRTLRRLRPKELEALKNSITTVKGEKTPSYALALLKSLDKETLQELLKAAMEGEER